MVNNLFKPRPHRFVTGSGLKRDVLISLQCKVSNPIVPGFLLVLFFNKGVLLWRLHGLGWGLSQGLQHQEPKDISPTPK